MASFSFGICAFNERRGLSRLIPMLLHQKYDHELEKLIVVSTESKDGTDELVKEWIAKDSRVELITEDERHGKWFSVNNLLKRANDVASDILVFIPADVLPARGAINSLLKHFEDKKVGLVSGHPVPADQTGFWGKIGNTLWEISHQTMNIKAEQGRLFHSSGELMAFKIGIVGSMPATINDDEFIANAIVEAGLEIVYDSDAIVRIWSPRSFKDWWTQRARVLRGHRDLGMMGKEVQSILLDRGLAIDAVRNIVFRKPRMIPAIFVLALIDSISLIKSKKPIPVSWEIATSAKPQD